MVTMTLAASLATYLSDGAGSPGHRSLTLDAETWPETVREIRQRHQRLGHHLFEESGRLRSGFLVAVNDEVSRRPEGPTHLRSGDHVYLFVQIAGG
ncbi:MoaD/ThiS family protein [Lentzea jiangxiensis]|uniref:ThiS family protein n=1 Tax=Lentzea jiangxiensis TaxID=641025 RepID=A0A1H0SGF2_9PSEU|nr:MoaD/ThiS family protein [Lentzea jiangxiensis]SDP40256.1 ThiS family protein [Lentzea jiangxiensis]